MRKLIYISVGRVAIVAPCQHIPSYKSMLKVDCVMNDPSVFSALHYNRSAEKPPPLKLASQVSVEASFSLTLIEKNSTNGILFYN